MPIERKYIFYVIEWGYLQQLEINLGRGQVSYYIIFFDKPNE